MSRQLFSPAWHSVARLRPKLAANVRIERHVYRGAPWHVAQEPVSGKFHRLSPSAYQFVSRLDGEATVQSIWDAMCAARHASDGDIPTQEDVVQLLMQLHAADLLQGDVVPDPTLLSLRHQKRERQSWKQWLLNPLSLKIPLLDPDHFLSITANGVSWLFTPLGFIVWLLLVLPAAFLAGQHWETLTNNASDQIFGGGNLWLMAIVFPIIKLAHELGHGYAVKSWGGQVREAGIMLLVFAPAPYVDASAASGFRSKWRRAVVGAAGMIVELAIAAIAMFVWLSVEPGLTRSVAYNVMVVAGVSTLVINGNPLLRYDAYYILCDLLEMPNLAQRGQRYLLHWWNRHVFGLHEQEPHGESAAEQRWLFSYTLVSWCYRVFITLSIALFVAEEFFFFGIAIAAWSITTLLIIPVAKGLRYVWLAPALERVRRRAVATTALGAFVILMVAFGVPMPSRTQSMGVVWLPEQSMLRAGESGFFGGWLVQPGQPVNSGEPIFFLSDSKLEADTRFASAKVDESRARLRVEQFSNPVKAEIAKRQLEHDEAVLTRALDRRARLLARAETKGVLAAQRPQDLVGQYFKKGELVAYILNDADLIARVAVDQADIDRVRTRLRSADLRLADALHIEHPTTILRQVPGGTQDLPSNALAIANGGAIAADPRESNGTKTLERIFLFDLALPENTSARIFGARVHVRFSHEFEPLGVQLWRRIRQLLLTRLGI